MKMNMRKAMVLFLLLFFAAGAALADTIYLKNGREVQGIFAGFENDEFMITDSAGNLLRFRADRVERVVIARDARGRDDYRRSQRGRWETFDAFDVGPDAGWVQSPVRVEKGQRFRVEASGTVTLDGRTKANPGGLSGQRSRNSPMPNQNVGALIVRIGSFNSPLLYVGQSGEIVADRDGILYFAVNSPRTGTSRGTFVVDLSLERRAGDSGDDRSGRFPGVEKTITVNGNQPWTDTGIDLQPNMTVEIVAEGRIGYDARSYTSPDGNRSLDREGYPVRKVGVGAVIAKIRYRDGRESNPFFIGARGQANTRQNEYGRLFIGVNDDAYGDNTGSYRVTIRNVAMDRGADDDRSGRSQEGEKTITVYANQPWTDTGIDFRPDMEIEFVAEGQIAYSSSGKAGPNGGPALGLINNYPLRNAGVGALIGKIRYRDGDESGPFFIGISDQVRTGQDEYGRLFIGINDDAFGDNKGYYNVTIRWR